MEIKSIKKEMILFNENVLDCDYYIKTPILVDKNYECILENFLFVFLGYYLLPLIFTGNEIQPLSISLGIALSTSIIEIVIGICDTPFIYLSKKFKCKNDNTDSI